MIGGAEKKVEGAVRKTGLVHAKAEHAAREAEAMERKPIDEQEAGSKS